MRKMTLLASLIMVLTMSLIVVRDTPATTIFNDGGTGTTHIIDYVINDDVRVDNATTLNVWAGANITLPSSTDGRDAISSYGNSIINVSGGDFTGGEDTDAGGSGHGMFAWESSTVSISAGTFTGGVKNTGSGGAGDGLAMRDSTLAITGGIFQGGSHANAGSIVAGHGLYTWGATGTISGGTFLAGSTSTYSVFGWIGSELDITGGTFEDGIRASSSIFNIYGTGLSYSGVSGDLLTGTLSDGSSISTIVSFSGTGAEINLFNQEEQTPVPEPTTIALLGIGLAGLAGAEVRRRRKRDRKSVV